MLITRIMLIHHMDVARKPMKKGIAKGKYSHYALVAAYAAQQAAAHRTGRAPLNALCNIAPPFHRARAQASSVSCWSPSRAATKRWCRRTTSVMLGAYASRSRASGQG